MENPKNKNETEKTLQINTLGQIHKSNMKSRLGKLYYNLLNRYGFTLTTDFSIDTYNYFFLLGLERSNKVLLKKNKKGQIVFKSDENRVYMEQNEFYFSDKEIKEVIDNH